MRVRFITLNGDFPLIVLGKSPNTLAFLGNTPRTVNYSKIGWLLHEHDRQNRLTFDFSFITCSTPHCWFIDNLSGVKKTCPWLLIVKQYRHDVDLVQLSKLWHRSNEVYGYADQ